MHDQGNEENLFDRVDFKPSQDDTHQPELRLHALLVPDAQFLRRAKRHGVAGLVVDNGGLGPNGLPVGPQDQRSKIRTFNIAPTGRM